MKLTIGQPPKLAPLTELPSIPCEMTQELYDLLGIPNLEDLVRAWLAERQESAPALSFHIPASGERAPGLHVSNLGHSEDGGLCPKQLWLKKAEGLESVVEPGRQMGFERGHATEAWLMAVLDQQMHRHGFRLERNLACDYVHPSGDVFTGELDGLFSGYTMTPNPKWVPGSHEPKDLWAQLQFVIDCKEVDDRALAGLDAPRGSNVCQMQGYLPSKTHDARFAVLAYVARWSLPRFFYVPCDDIATHRRAAEVLSLTALPDAPKALAPSITVTKNQGPDSIKLELPWQCQYCAFLDNGCDGALPVTARPKGVCGHTEGGKVTLKREKFAKASDEEFELTEALIARHLEG